MSPLEEGSEEGSPERGGEAAESPGQQPVVQTVEGIFGDAADLSSS